jgi:hypothetical protein
MGIVAFMESGDLIHVPDRAKQEVSPGASMDGFTAFRRMTKVSGLQS